MGVGLTLARRAAALTLALIMVIFITSIIITVSGYDVMIFKSIISMQVRMYARMLEQKGHVANITAAIEKYRQYLINVYGLNKPTWERAFIHVKNILLLNLGYTQSEEVCSIAGLPYPAPVSAAIMAALPRTIVMLTTSQIICAAIALPIGALIAYKRGSLLDRAIITYAAAFNAIPIWWLAMIFILIFGFELGIAPTDYRIILAILNNFWKDPAHMFVQLLWCSYVPIIVLVISFLGSWFYSVRAIVLRVVAEDFVFVAKAKGLSDEEVARRHVLRAAMPAVMTMTILSLAGSIGGMIITESVFDWPGMGMLYYAAITTADAATILGLVFITTLVYVCARFLLEVLYIYLDPRVRL